MSQTAGGIVSMPPLLAHCCSFRESLSTLRASLCVRFAFMAGMHNAGFSSARDAVLIPRIAQSGPFFSAEPLQNESASERFDGVRGRMERMSAHNSVR